jgi:hypothetical protein
LSSKTRIGKRSEEITQVAVPLFWADSIVLVYADVLAAKKWWITAFDCKELPFPSDRWDNPRPSDVALKFPGTDEPTVLLSSRSEGGEPSEHPIIFTSKVKKAYEHLRARGVVAAGPVHDEWGIQLFQITDSEGNAIEICKEP